MKILFYDTKKYDRDSFEKILPEYSDLEVEFFRSRPFAENSSSCKRI